MSNWCQVAASGLRMAIWAVPGTRSSEVTGVVGDELKIRLQAAPVQGQANAALIRFLADRLSVPQKSVCLLRGGTSRHKLLLIQANLDLAQVQRALLPAPAKSVY